MIASVTGVLAGRAGDTIVVHTDGGVGYAVTVPAGVAERLPAAGGRVSLHTELVVKEDGWALYGFDRPGERLVFQRLLGASGFGPKLALALLSALGPERTVRSIRARDLAALSSVGGIGRKKAERLVLELQDRFDDVPLESRPAGPAGGDDAVRALVGLGYGSGAADDAVRAALAGGASAEDTSQLIRRALQQLAARGGR
jgi:Holliday junction DNA helicase RuvA